MNLLRNTSFAKASVNSDISFIARAVIARVCLTNTWVVLTVLARVEFRTTTSISWVDQVTCSSILAWIIEGTSIVSQITQRTVELQRTNTLESIVQSSKAGSTVGARIRSARIQWDFTSGSSETVQACARRTLTSHTANATVLAHVNFAHRQSDFTVRSNEVVWTNASVEIERGLDAGAVVLARSGKTFVDVDFTVFAKCARRTKTQPNF
jgi:hypothetical protein